METVREYSIPSSCDESLSLPELIGPTGGRPARRTAERKKLSDEKRVQRQEFDRTVWQRLDRLIRVRENLDRPSKVEKAIEEFEKLQQENQKLTQQVERLTQQVEQLQLVAGLTEDTTLSGIAFRSSELPAGPISQAPVAQQGSILPAKQEPSWHIESVTWQAPVGYSVDWAQLPVAATELGYF